MVYGMSIGSRAFYSFVFFYSVFRCHWAIEQKVKIGISFLWITTLVIWNSSELTLAVPDVLTVRDFPEPWLGPYCLREYTWSNGIVQCISPLWEFSFPQQCIRLGADSEYTTRSPIHPTPHMHTGLYLQTNSYSLEIVRHRTFPYSGWGVADVLRSNGI